MNDSEVTREMKSIMSAFRKDSRIKECFHPNKQECNVGYFIFLKSQT